MDNHKNQFIPTLKQLEIIFFSILLNNLHISLDCSFAIRIQEQIRQFLTLLNFPLSKFYKTGNIYAETRAFP